MPFPRTTASAFAVLALLHLVSYTIPVNAKTLYACVTPFFGTLRFVASPERCRARETPVAISTPEAPPADATELGILPAATMPASVEVPQTRLSDTIPASLGAIRMMPLPRVPASWEVRTTSSGSVS